MLNKKINKWIKTICVLVVFMFAVTGFTVAHAASSDIDIAEENTTCHSDFIQISSFFKEYEIVEVGQTQHFGLVFDNSNFANQNLQLEIKNTATQESILLSQKGVKDNIVSFEFTPTQSQFGDYYVSSLKCSNDGVVNDLLLAQSQDEAPKFSVVDKIEVDKFADNTDIIIADVNNMPQMSNRSMLMATPSLYKSKGKTTIVIDPGHGGADSGAPYKWGSTTYYEKDFTLAIAKECAAKLRELGFNVIMTRDSDTHVCSGSYDLSRDLRSRVKLAAENNADFFMSIHINSAGSNSTSANGVEVWLPLGSSTYLKEETYAPAKIVSKKVLDNLVSLGFNNRGLKAKAHPDDLYADGSKADYLCVIRESRKKGIPSCLVEHGFINNSHDIKYLTDSSKIKQMGIADAMAIYDYFGPQGGWEKQGNSWIYKFGDGSKAVSWYEINGNWYYFNNQGIMQTDWYFDGSNYFYLGTNGDMARGWKKINSSWYYFNNSGYMKTGWQVINNNWYLFDTNGKMRTGWCESNGHKCYLSHSGSMVRGWYKLGDTWYYFDWSGYMQTGWQDINGAKYYFDPQGKMLANQWHDEKYLNASGAASTSSWQKNGHRWWFRYADGSYPTNKIVEINNSSYYFDRNGYMKTNWVYFNNNWYYFDSNGYMKTGWQVINNNWYLFDTNGKMRTGWCESNGHKCYLSHSGSMVRGWYKLGDTWYYFDWSGYMQTGWQDINGAKYYFDPQGKMLANQWHDEKYLNASGAASTSSWQKNGHRWWFRYADGSYPTNKIVEINNSSYYFDRNGYMKTNWVYFNNNWYYFDSNGYMKTGWQVINNNWYLFDTNGKMRTGWCESNGYKCYLSDSGSMARGWNKLGDTWYYFNNSGYMQTGWQVIDNNWYLFDTNGKMRTGWCESNGHKCYLNGSGAMARSWNKLGSTWYYFDWSGYMQTGWQDINEVKYCFDPNGRMYTGVVTIGGRLCQFATSGAFDDYLDKEPIMGESKVGVDSLVKTYNRSASCSYPAEFLGPKGASDISAFCSILCREAKDEGVRADVLFSQVMLETGWLSSDKAKLQCNFGGLGVTGNGVEGNKFNSVEIGLRAQVQHLKAYASTDKLNKECVDKRYDLVVPHGKAKYVRLLSGTWAADKNYGVNIIKIMNSIAK